LVKVGQTRKNLVKVWNKSEMVQIAQSYEMVGNCNYFKALVMFAVKNCELCLFWKKNI
jgi:hypothetical protein